MCLVSPWGSQFRMVKGCRLVRGIYNLYRTITIDLFPLGKLIHKQFDIVLEFWESIATNFFVFWHCHVKHKKRYFYLCPVASVLSHWNRFLNFNMHTDHLGPETRNSWLGMVRREWFGVISSCFQGLFLSLCTWISLLMVSYHMWCKIELGSVASKELIPVLFSVPQILPFWQAARWCPCFSSLEYILCSKMNNKAVSQRNDHISPFLQHCVHMATILCIYNI